ncbi:hypothetical protein NMG60_11025713 [Bertholletia excelsa]
MRPRKLYQITVTDYPQQQKAQNNSFPLKSSIPIVLPLPCPRNLSNHIRDCISRGAHREALLAYAGIRHLGVYVLGVVPLLLKACASFSAFNHGKALHAESIKMGVEADVMLGTSLVDMYAKCGNIFDSRKMFDQMPRKNVVTCNAMIGGYMKNGDTRSALLLFEQMATHSAVTWIEMINGLAKSGDTASARQLFDRVPVEMRNVVTWTAMVDGYAINGKMDAAKEVFEEMPVRNFFVWSSMISGYCKKGDIEAAKVIFCRIPERNLVNWNSLIAGLSQNGYCEEALDTFAKMKIEGFEPDKYTLVSVLSACAQLGLLDVGKQIHQMIVHKGFKLNQYILNGLVDMYAKCGDLSTARLLFEKLPKRNDACWNVMISSFAMHGHCQEALQFFGSMEASGVDPNEITFLSVLSACAHGGFLEEGLETFSKIKKYGLTATVKHYGCLIDLLGRAGRLREAYDLIKKMPMKPNNTIWGTLLGACRIHSNADMADWVLKEVLRDSDPYSSNASHYVLLSNIYAASDSWEKAERMRIVMSDKGLRKAPGLSSLLFNSTQILLRVDLFYLLVATTDFHKRMR